MGKFSLSAAAVAISIMAIMTIPLATEAADLGVQPAGPHVVPISPDLRLSSLASRPDSDQVELSDGKRVRLGELRRMDQAARRLRSAPATAIVPAPLRHKPAATGKRVDSPTALAEALKYPDNETIELPSGHRLTVGQLRFLQPQIEKRLGRSINNLNQRPDLSGRATRVTGKSDWKALLNQPDHTVLESPGGKRITVGELKHAIRTGVVPVGTKPAKRR
ncbi:MAG: hypothetical protein R2940_16905 [Syntrophotaleaceae bacterium]